MTEERKDAIGLLAEKVMKFPGMANFTRDFLFSKWNPFENAADAVALMEALRLLGQVKNSMSSSTMIDLSTTKSLRLQIKSSSFSCSLVGIDPESMPFIPEPEEEPCAAVPFGILLECIGRTRFAAADDEFACIQLQCDGSSVKAVGLGHHRISVTDLPVACSTFGPIRIPVRAAGIIESIPLAADAMVSIFIGERAFSFHAGNVKMIARRAEVRFPDYLRMVPKKRVHSVSVPRESLKTLISSVLPFADRGKVAPKVSLRIDKSGLAITANNAEYGDFDSHIAAISTVDEIAFCINPRYLIDFIASTSETDVSIFPGGEWEVLEMRPGDGSSQEYRHLIAPMAAG